MMKIGARKFGIFLITMSIILSILYPLFHQQIIHFCEICLSSDHEISPHGLRELISTFYFGMGLIFCIGYYFYNAQDENWRTKVRKIFLDEPLCRNEIVRPSPRLILFCSSLVGFLLILIMRLAYRFPSVYPFFYKKDHGLLDLCVPITISISAVLLFAVVWKLWKDNKFLRLRNFLTIAFSFLIILFIFYSGEETSWGQDFFNWETPSFFSGNIENQTNIHNYFNDYFDYGYISLSIISVIVLVSAWLEFNNRWMPYNRIVLPHPSLIGLSLLISFVSIVWFCEQELLEEMVAAFIFFYSLRIFSCFRSKNLTFETSARSNK